MAPHTSRGIEGEIKLIMIRHADSNERPNDHELGEAASWISVAKDIVVFTGAGASAESGIPTFRDEDGLWDEFPVEEFGNWRDFLTTLRSQPHKIARFLYHFLAPIVDAKPNDCHRAISVLQQKVRTTIVTQNIDRLHQRAGSEGVLELHGSLFDIFSESGKPVATLTLDDLAKVVEELRPSLTERFTLERLMKTVQNLMGENTSGSYRPNLVLFGDLLDRNIINQARECAEECNCMIIIGTSGEVYPANELPLLATANGARVIAVGPEKPYFSADSWLRGSAALTVPDLIERC